MRSIITTIILSTLGLLGCATQQVLPQPSPDVTVALDDYIRALNEAAPSDPVVDSRDPAVKARLTPPVELHRTQPALSREARGQSREGKVVVAGVIERDGSVSHVKALSASGHNDFTGASLEAVRQWRYSPGIIDGAPVRLLLTVTTTYRTD